MYRCILCGFDVVLADVRIEMRGGRCICLRCFLRETCHTERLGAALRREIEQAAGGA
jgi:hypothetical protein